MFRGNETKVGRQPWFAPDAAVISFHMALKVIFWVTLGMDTPSITNLGGTPSLKSHSSLYSSSNLHKMTLRSRMAMKRPGQA